MKVYTLADFLSFSDEEFTKLSENDDFYNSAARVYFGLFSRIAFGALFASVASPTNVGREDYENIVNRSADALAPTVPELRDLVLALYSGRNHLIYNGRGALDLGGTWEIEVEEV